MHKSHFHQPCSCIARHFGRKGFGAGLFDPATDQYRTWYVTSLVRLFKSIHLNAKKSERDERGKRNGRRINGTRRQESCREENGKPLSDREKCTEMESRQTEIIAMSTHLIKLTMMPPLCCKSKSVIKTIRTMSTKKQNRMSINYRIG